MKKILEDARFFLVELIGLIGGIILGKNTNWDYEPLILLAISILGILIFVIIKILPIDEEKPVLELEMISGSSTRSSEKIIPNVSPTNQDGIYISEPDGIYFYEIDRDFDLIVRNISIQNAYSVKIYVPKVDFLIFRNDIKSLEPLTINIPKIVKMNYRVEKGMTRQAAVEVQNDLTLELKNIKIIIEYQNEKRKTFYTKFTPINNNKPLKKRPDLSDYKII